MINETNNTYNQIIAFFTKHKKDLILEMKRAYETDNGRLYSNVVLYIYLLSDAVFQLLESNKDQQ